MRPGKFKVATFILATVICCVLTFITLIGAGVVDEGNGGNTGLRVIPLLLSKLFYVFRFPTHTLFFDFMNGPNFFLGLLVNCLMYGFVVERVIAFFKAQQNRRNA
jgi:hypothetical protein